MTDLHPVVLRYSPLIYNLHKDDLHLAFHPEHWADLFVKSDLKPETIKGAQIFSVPGRDIARILTGCYIEQRVKSALAFPYLGTSLVRLKIFPPYKDKNGRTVKYLAAKNSPTHLYIPAKMEALLTNTSIPINVVEGEKKTLRAIQEGLPSVGIAGIWGWSSGKKPIPDLDKINWNDRQVTLFPDGDILTNNEIRRGANALGQELKRRGAICKVALIRGAAHAV